LVGAQRLNRPFGLGRNEPLFHPKVCPVPPGLLAAQKPIVTGKSTRRRIRLNRYTYWFSVNWVNSSKPLG
jgi:hypothetical protein